MNNHMGIKKGYTRWVPKLLTPIQRANRVDCCQELLQQSEVNPAKFFDCIVTAMNPGFTTTILSASWKPRSGRGYVNKHQLDSAKKDQLERL